MGMDAKGFVRAVGECRHVPGWCIHSIGTVIDARADNIILSVQPNDKLDIWSAVSAC